MKIQYDDRWLNVTKLSFYVSVILGFTLTLFGCGDSGVTVTDDGSTDDGSTSEVDSGMGDGAVSCTTTSATVYADADGDGYGTSTTSQTLCEGDTIPEGYVENAYDCDDGDASNWVVLSDGNSGDYVGLSGLQTAIDEIDESADGLICLIPGNFTGDSEVVITGNKTVRIVANSIEEDKLSILDGENVHRLMTVREESAETLIVSLEGLVIQNGYVDNDTATNKNQGGGMWSDGADLTLKDCVFASNFSDDSGGGAYINLTDDGQLLTVETTQWNGNSAADVQGGGLRVDSPAASVVITITNNTFSENDAYAAGGGLFIVAEGAASQINVEESTFSLNEVTSASDSGGGGFYSYTSDENSSLIVTDCIFSGNNVTAASSDGFAYGGGLYAEAAGDSFGSTTGVSQITISGGSFTENHADDQGGGATIVTSASGTTGSIANISTVTFTSNDAAYGAGLFVSIPSDEATGEITVDTCTFTTNAATQYGGGVMTYANNVSVGIAVKNSTFTSNTAPSGGDAIASYVISGESNICTSVSNTFTDDSSSIYEYDDT